MSAFARIRITWPKGALSATLDDTPTVRALVAALPVKANAQTWGEEVYFEAHVNAALERGARQVVEPGTVCFWVEGSALALPWGRTPISEGDESRLVTRCNVLGRMDGDARQLASVRSGDSISVDLE
ncbi:MAG: cyclophilin-like fold protein [Burkholderiales bacterium]